MKWLFRQFGITRVFEQAPENDPNSPNLSGGEPGDVKPTGGGSVEDGKGQKSDPPVDKTYDIKVGGEKRSVTVEEALKLAEKAGGADKALQDAAEMRKAAEPAIRQQELIRKMGEPGYTPSDAEVRELAGMINVDPDDFLAYLAEGEKSTDTPKDKGGGLSDAGFTEKISDEAVDKDEVFGKMIVGEDKEGRSESIRDMVAEDVLGRIKDGETFGAELVTASIQKVRAHLSKFGIPKGPNLPITLGLGPGSSLPADVQSEKPIARVSAAEDGDDSNFVKRAQQKALQMLRQSVKR
ncbi:MAG: hypothetical protein ACYTEX_28170 [Planctomycetota bacterium]|jgi:hypothetical protein